MESFQMDYFVRVAPLLLLLFLRHRGPLAQVLVLKERNQGNQGNPSSPTCKTTRMPFTKGNGFSESDKSLLSYMQNLATPFSAGLGIKQFLIPLHVKASKLSFRYYISPYFFEKNPSSPTCKSQQPPFLPIKGLRNWKIPSHGKQREIDRGARVEGIISFRELIY